jgi:hypothetical protein
MLHRVYIYQRGKRAHVVEISSQGLIDQKREAGTQGQQNPLCLPVPETAQTHRRADKAHGESIQMDDTSRTDGYLPHRAEQPEAHRRVAVAMASLNPLGKRMEAIPGDGSGGSPNQVLYTVEQERSAAYTASYTGALLVLAQLAVHLGAPDIAAALPQLPAQAEEILSRQDEIRTWVRVADLDKRFMYAGNGLNGWTAAEGALKAKEASYVTAEGMATEHLLHGPFFGLNPGDHLLLLNTPGPFSARAVDLASLAHEIGLDILWFGTSPTQPAGLKGFPVGETLEVVSPILAVVPLQLLACYLAEARGANPDSARMDVEPFAQPLTRFLEQKKF